MRSNFSSVTPSPEKAGFAARLNQVCDLKGLPPADGRGRQPALAKIFDVNTKAARKWLVGEGFPELEMVIRICNWAEVNVDWLLRGVGPMRGTKIETRLLALGDLFNQLNANDREEVLDLMQLKLLRSRHVFAADDPAFTKLVQAWLPTAPPPGSPHN